MYKMLIICCYIAAFRLSLIIFANLCCKPLLNALLIHHGSHISVFGKRITGNAILIILETKICIMVTVRLQPYKRHGHLICPRQ